MENNFAQYLRDSLSEFSINVPLYIAESILKSDKCPCEYYLAGEQATRYHDEHGAEKMAKDYETEVESDFWLAKHKLGSSANSLVSEIDGALDPVKIPYIDYLHLKHLKVRMFASNILDWEFVMENLPEYYSRDDIFRVDILQRIIDNEFNHDDSRNKMLDRDYYSTKIMLDRDYYGDINNPQIQIDHLELEIELYEEAIENYKSKK